MLERTLSIIKPDAVERDLIGEIYKRFESNGLQIIAAKMTQLTTEQCKEFYSVHASKAFFNDLVSYMTSGPIMVQVLQGENAIAKNRALMGHTDPKKAELGSIRNDFAKSIEANSVHGSDHANTAKVEIAFFFGQNTIYPR